MDLKPMDDNMANPNSAPHSMQSAGLWNMRLTPNFWFKPPGMQTHQQSYSHPMAYWHNPHSLPNQSIPNQEPFHGQAMPTSPAIPEQKKHKRTRSGCFTCRARRVKCDEKRPTCDPIAESESEGDEKHQDTARIPSSDHSQSGKSPEQKTARYPGHGTRRNTASRRSQQIARKHNALNSEAKITTGQDTSASPASDMTAHSTGSHSPMANADASVDPSVGTPDSASSVADTSNCSDEVRFFLGYHTQHITHSHYMMKSIAAKFISEDMMRYALEYEPLLYAVVAFSAYHYSIRHPNGRLYTFLQYYNKSVSSLLHSLKSRQPHKDATILTILQLTTFEEYVGDWVNLIDHHQAAHRMILELYSPDKILEDDFHMHILHWHMRYDVMAGLMAGNAAILDREWYLGAEKLAYQSSAEDSTSLSKKLFALCARNKRCAMDFASLLAKVSQNLISPEEFLAEGQIIRKTMGDMIHQLSLENDPQYLVMDYPDRVALGINDIVDPYVPGLVHTSPLWEVDLVKLELRSSLFMFKCQIDLITQTLEVSELSKFALEQCQLVETINRLRDKSPMFPLMFHNVVGLICLYIPRDDRHRMWCRRILAEIEQHG
ncbi:uncharacterized protein GIQ15_06168 [Arthroderma uncinatum]|uniref:uncharacterized protein n=1 Tax=Arthroderma uncinatum TaxID=74035 RepID=UPI00144A60B6|nr:uncharacterized protein GIQ15_06168 [Arthroderma uncinatum]KAF3480821.1 hypothetical protein GIQ15_06168 [Arthroderma uncinatum]